MTCRTQYPCPGREWTNEAQTRPKQSQPAHRWPLGVPKQKQPHILLMDAENNRSDDHAEVLGEHSRTLAQAMNFALGVRD